MCDNGILNGVFIVIFGMINASDWNKVVNVKLFFKVVQLNKLCLHLPFWSIGIECPCVVGTTKYLEA